MIIEEINVNNFGCLTNKKIKFTSGLNMIYGNNESGKSTVFAFVKFMLYGIKVHKTNNSVRFKKKFMPWSGQPISGTMKIVTDDGCVYEIFRMVSETKNIIKIVDLKSGTSITNNDFLKSPGKYLLSLGEEAFSNVSYLSDFTSKSSMDKDGDIILAISGDKSYEKSYMQIKDKLNSRISDLSSERKKNSILPSLYNQRNEIVKRNSEKQKLCLDKQTFIKEIEKLQNDITEKKYILESLIKANNVNNSAYNELGKIMSNPLSKFFGITSTELYSVKFSSVNISVYLFIAALLSFLVIYIYAKHINIILLWLSCFGAFATVSVCIFKIVQKHRVLNKYNVANYEEFIKEYSLFQNLSLQKEKIESILENKLREKNVKLIQIDNHDFTIENNNDKIELLKDELSQINTKIAVLNEKISQIDVLLKTYDNLDNDIKAIDNKIEENSKMLSSYKLALDILEKSFNQIKNSFSPQLNESAKKYFETITGKDNVEILFDESFTIKYKTKYGYTDSGFLSRGTSEQLYTAFRFALCDCVSNGIILPMFLDDAFNNYDDNRLFNMLKFIREQSSKRQIFITSCRANEFLFFRNEDINIIEFNSERNDFNG